MGEQRGSQIAEFALILPILCFLVLSGPVLSMAVRSWYIVEAAAREGARAAAIIPGISEGGVRQVACSYLDMAQLRYTHGGVVLFRCDDSFVKVNVAQATVEISYKQPAYIPGLGLLLGGAELNVFEIQGRAVYRPERR